MYDLHRGGSRGGMFDHVHDTPYGQDEGTLVSYGEATEGMSQPSSNGHRDLTSMLNALQQGTKSVVAPYRTPLSGKGCHREKTTTQIAGDTAIRLELTKNSGMMLLLASPRRCFSLGESASSRTWSGTNRTRREHRGGAIIVINSGSLRRVDARYFFPLVGKPPRKRWRCFLSR